MNILTEEYQARKEIKEEKEVVFDKTALFKIEYGLYVVTSNDGKKDNGCIVNTVTQLTDTPFRVAVNINKANYSHDVIKKTKKLNVNILSQDTTFDLIKKYGFVSGKDVNKFEGEEVERSNNGLAILNDHINAFLSLEVEEYPVFSEPSIDTSRAPVSAL